MPLDFTKISNLVRPIMDTTANNVTRWHRPIMSRRELADVRKLALIAGAPWEQPENIKHEYKPLRMIPLRGPRAERVKAARIEKTKELMKGQMKLWAEKNKQRRDKVKSERKNDIELLSYYVTKSTEPHIHKKDTAALELYKKRKTARAAKEKLWAEQAKGAVQKQKLSGEERLAKKRAEREEKKSAKKTETTKEA